MCGIAGIAGRTDPAARESVSRMVLALRHRGPDDSGVNALDGAVFGHTRLSIIDLASGHQPLGSPDGRFWITFNGEIYNYRELRAELQAAGCAFRTSSDTEVLLAAYRQWGADAFARLNGMYACAIWDNATRRLVALRDRAGKKPFYYALRPGGSLLFASEPKALIASGLVSTMADPSALDAYLALGYVPPQCSVFRDIRVLPAGSYFVWEAGEPRPRAYWRPKLLADNSIEELAAAEELRRRVGRAVESRMVADVPIGAFLSGGADSTTVASLMARHSARPIRTFSVGFGDLINELPAAGAVARHLASEHHEIQVDLKVGELLGRMAEIYDEPLADSSSIPTFVVSEFARKQVKVVLTGDGGDELFAGYDWWYRPLAASERLPKGRLAYACLRLASRILAMAVRLGLPLNAPRTRLWEDRRLIDLARAHPDLWARQRANATRFSSELRRSLWRPELREVVQPPQTAACPGELSGMSRAFWFDVTAYLPGDILVKLDRASMAVGLEARCPLLDPDLIEFALTLPTSLKLRGEEGKYIFRRAFETSWPEAVRGKPKHGFGAPHAAWLRRDDVRSIVDRVLTAADSPLARWLRLDEVRARTRSHYASGTGFSASQVWTLMTLGLWAERWQASAPA